MILKNNEKLKEKDFVNEKELQTYFEEHLKEILGLEFVSTEFVVGNFRLDTVAFEEETKSFKIIEYKNVKNLIKSTIYKDKIKIRYRFRYQKAVSKQYLEL